MSGLRLSPSPSPTRPNFDREFSDSENENEDFVSDQGSQRSISLSSPRNSVLSKRESDVPSRFQLTQVETPTASEFHAIASHFEGKEGKDTIETESTDAGVRETIMSPSVSSLSYDDETRRSSQTSVTTSSASIKFSQPPLPPRSMSTATSFESETASMASYSSTSSRKARPESMLMQPPTGPLVPGIALVDFNHLVGPKIEFFDGTVFHDEQLAAILPFLALPDGAHLSSEDYSYFHLVPASPHPTTVFGISCNRQIKTADLLAKDDDVTRSTVQKAVVVLASKPLFGPIRDRLCVVTQALFSQRDFRETGILVDFKNSLEMSLRNQLTESALYMGTNLRELVHKFRSRTLLLLKSLILQKRIMFYGHPVERLCTYQYSLISLIPGLLQYLDDCGSPPLASRSLSLRPPTSLRTSDRKSLMAYLGLPLDIFGKDAFFQPYLPLQQVDLIKDTRSYVCGSTNSIVTQQKEVDLLVNIEANTFEFRDPQLDRLVALTAADRKWMDDIVKDVNESWCDDPDRSANMKFKGSDDYIRTKFEEYVAATLASVKHQDFLLKSSRSDVVLTGADGGDANAIQDFNPSWIADFRRTNAYEVWNRITDPMIFDIIEARHPCSTKPSVVEDIGLRLQEGIQDLHIQEQLAPTKEAISRNFLKAVEGVKGRWAQRSATGSGPLTNGSSTAVDASSSEGAGAGDVASVKTSGTRSSTFSLSSFSHSSSGTGAGLRSLSLTSNQSSSAIPAATTNPNMATSPSTSGAASVAADAKATLGSWGSSIGSFISQRAARLSAGRTNSLSGNNPSNVVYANGTANAGADANGRVVEKEMVESPASMSNRDSTSTASNTKGRAGTTTQSKPDGADSGQPTPSTPLSSIFSSWSFSKATTPSPSASSTSTMMATATTAEAKRPVPAVPVPPLPPRRLLQLGTSRASADTDIDKDKDKAKYNETAAIKKDEAGKHEDKIQTHSRESGLDESQDHNQNQSRPRSPTSVSARSSISMSDNDSGNAVQAGMAL